MRFFYYLAIYPYNFLIFPYFNNFGRISTAWMWFIAFGIYFTVVGGLVLWPVVYWYIRKQKKTKKPKLQNTFLQSLAISTFNTILLISLFFLLSYTGNVILPSWLATVFLSPIVLPITVTLLTSLINYFIANYLLQNNVFSLKPTVYLVTLLTALLTTFLMTFVLIGPNRSFCAESNRLVTSSGYAAHGDELCYQRQDTSECPQSPSELKAFRPQDYEKLQNCYYPAKVDNGYILYPRFLDADIF